MIDPGFKGKVALVTGGNNPFGIGAAIARAMASHGAAVFIHYFRRTGGKPAAGATADEPGLEFFYKQQAKTADEVIKSVREAGGEAHAWEVDLSIPRGVHTLFDRAEEAFGRVDILVNNAAEYAADTFLSPNPAGESAIWVGGPPAAVDEQTHDRHFAVNTRAAVVLMKRFAARIIEQKRGWGRIVNISADCAWGCPKEVSYRASKYALESYSRSAAAELGPYGITVNVVSPGPVQSGYIPPELEQSLVADIPARRVGLPEDIANAVVFFASEQAAWITGQVLFVHGGHRMAPGR